MEVYTSTYGVVLRESFLYVNFWRQKPTTTVYVGGVENELWVCPTDGQSLRLVDHPNRIS